MGRVWRRAAALGIATVVLLVITVTLWTPAAGRADAPADGFREAMNKARVEKIQLTAQVVVALGAAAMGAGSDGDADRTSAASLITGRALFLSPEGSPAPSWTAVAAIAPLGAMAALLLFLRPLPTLHLAGSLYSVATSRAPPPPMMSALLRMVAIGLLGFALASPLLFEPLLLASTSLLLVSLVASPGPVAA